MKKLMQISMSGGETSAFMAKRLIDNYSGEWDFIVTFANTGPENEKTLEFVNNCDNFFGFNTVWLEADVQHGQRASSRHRLVTFETASRAGEPFREVIKKYGVPNKKYPHCNRELKLNPMRSYLKSIGIDHASIPTAIGIRSDEKRRVSKDSEKMNLIYPLIDWFETDKQDVLEFWENESFKLGLEEWDGNCSMCFKKSMKKQFRQLDQDKKVIYFHMLMEKKYKQVGNKPRYPDRVFFRGNIPAHKLLEMWDRDRRSENPETGVDGGGCSESCEIYACE